MRKRRWSNASHGTYNSWRVSVWIERYDLGSNCDLLSNKAGYTATPVTCRWEGAIFEVTWAFRLERWGQGIKNKKNWKTWWADRWMDRQMDGWTEGRMDRWIEGCRNALHTTNNTSSSLYQVKRWRLVESRYWIVSGTCSWQQCDLCWRKEFPHKCAFLAFLTKAWWMDLWTNWWTHWLRGRF